MRKLVLDSNLLSLPVTDLKHVIREINKHRMTCEALNDYYRRKIWNIQNKNL